jgi:hypothetical protein
MKLFDRIFKRNEMLYEFKRDENGKHQIGGDTPTDFKMPFSKFMTEFQYLGFIDNSDEIFSWLPFKLHLICPIYLDIETVFLDYTDHLSPILLSPEDSESVTSAYDDLDRNSMIVYESVKVKLEQVDIIDDFNCIGTAGKPAWLQHSNIPTCPKSGRQMKFLCTLMSFGDIKTKSTNIVSTYPDFNQMTFWGDGNLYVFIEPKEKTVCYFIQNT